MVGFQDVPEEVNVLGRIAIGHAIAVHRRFGAGLLERPYKLALAQALADAGHHVRMDVPFAIDVGVFADEKAFEADIILDDTVILELKSVEDIHIRHVMQVKTYLRIAALPLGYVLNFGLPRLQIRRIVP